MGAARMAYALWDKESLSPQPEEPEMCSTVIRSCSQPPRLHVALFPSPSDRLQGGVGLEDLKAIPQWALQDAGPPGKPFEDPGR